MLIYILLKKYAGVAELADALVLGKLRLDFILNFFIVINIIKYRIINAFEFI